jgi:heptosyltransferase-3
MLEVQCTLKEMGTRVLLIQLGDIGDIVWMIPAIRAVKSAYAGSKVSVLLKKSFCGILEDDHTIDRIFTVPDSKGFDACRDNFSLIRSIRACRFDMVIDLRAGDRGAFMSLLSGAPRRIAMLYRDGVPFWRNWAYTDLVDPVRVKKRGAAEQSLMILREIGIATDDEVPSIHVPDAKRARALAALRDSGVAEGDRWVSINPFSRWSYKEIHTGKWIEIINWLWSDFRLRTVLVGSPEERQRAGQIAARTGDHFINFAGSTKLGDLPALLSLSLLHIGVDSAAPHIAAAVGTPTITIYGPSDWFDWAPLGEAHAVVTPDMDCSPCRRKGCDDGGKSKCLDELPVEKIKAAIQKRI